FFFRFKRYSDALEQFQYEAVGGIQDTGRFDACGAPQTAKASHDPWPDGGLTINRSLTSYEGELASSKESPWTFTCSAVPGMTAPAQLFQNMDTLEGSKQRPRMKPSDIRLMGAGNGPNAIYDWDFQADVPSQ
ncbi:MAG TPA: hypothetical protein VLN26_19340, partial [Gaiellaceae bacterium]|nr:hypothetical protein [Gaiellaceae bacterium]